MTDISSNQVPVYLSLGSNLGDRMGYLEKALEFLGQRLIVTRISPVYDTAPQGNKDQPRFLNLTCEVRTRLSPEQVLALAKVIEMKLGRPRGTSNLPRPIDIDILFYDNQVINTADLVIPHPRLTERAFVLVPLARIAPDFVHPVSGKAVKDLLAEITGDQGVVEWRN